MDWSKLLTGYVLLGSLFLVMWVTTIVSAFLLLKQERQSNQRRETVWEQERERLLNRAMTREWQTYIQMEAAKNPSVVSSSNSDLVKGMSDEEEMRRAGQSIVDSLGLGEEVNYGLDDDARDLGLTP